MEHQTFHRILAAIIAVLIVLAGYGVYYVNDYHTTSTPHHLNISTPLTT